MGATVTNISKGHQKGTHPKSKYIVEVLQEPCIGAASCVAIAAETFELNEANKAYILETDWDSDDLVLAAAQSCPVFAIIIKDAKTGKQIFPQEE
ncbi:MAG: ferredoxin [Candidatus Dojkabacteria bacterium]